MNSSTVPLCCCEYYDVNQERNHILACCCNCVDLDESFERLITFKSVPQKHKAGLMNTFQDRLRIPWRGGAKQVAFDALLPILILPITFLVASISLWWMIFSFTTILIFLGFTSNFFIKTIPRTKFFFIWTVTSLVLLCVIFEFIVIPFLEILLEENIALGILISGFILCWYLMQSRNKELANFEESELERGSTFKAIERLQNCPICQIKIPGKDHHCVWLDCCVGKHNQWLFILAIFFAISALLFSSNLALTSVCHPFTFYKTILLPDDCSDVYQVFELSISFVSAVYSLLVATLLLILFLHQILLVSLGMSAKEWCGLPFKSKLLLGLNSNRPNSKGFVKNWLSIVCWKRNFYGAFN